MGRIRGKSVGETYGLPEPHNPKGPDLLPCAAGPTDLDPRTQGPNRTHSSSKKFTLKSTHGRRQTGAFFADRKGHTAPRLASNQHGSARQLTRLASSSPTPRLASTVCNQHGSARQLTRLASSSPTPRLASSSQHGSARQLTRLVEHQHGSARQLPDWLSSSRCATPRLASSSPTWKCNALTPRSGEQFTNSPIWSEQFTNMEVYQCQDSPIGCQSDSPTPRLASYQHGSARPSIPDLASRFTKCSEVLANSNNLVFEAVRPTITPTLASTSMFVRLRQLKSWPSGFPY